MNKDFRINFSKHKLPSYLAVDKAQGSSSHDEKETLNCRQRSSSKNTLSGKGATKNGD